MSIVGFIVVGDRTSHGGIVVSGCPNFLVHGQPIARVGDRVFCPRCGDTVITTSSYPSFITDGVSVPYDKDLTSCGAVLYSRHNNLNGWGSSDDSPMPDHDYEKTDLEVASENGTFVPQKKFQEHFTLYDLNTGAVMPKVAYFIKNSEGEVFEGETNSEGKTDVVWTDSPRPIDITIVEKQEGSNDKYHTQTGDYDGL